MRPTELTGLLGWAERVMTALGEWGVGVLVLLETVFPPLPSEVVLPLAGFLTSQGELNLALVIATSTLGAYLGALGLYGLGAALGQDRSIRLLAQLPLVDREDFERADAWFGRHGKVSIFFGRLIPGVRSLISLPAGAQRMSLVTFSVFTIAGSGVWNGILIGAGAALGTQYALVDRYSRYINYALYAVHRRTARLAGRPPGAAGPGASGPGLSSAGRRVNPPCICLVGTGRTVKDRTTHRQRSFMSPRSRLRLLFAALLAAMLSVALVAPAEAKPRHDYPDRIELPVGFLPEGITIGRAPVAYLGSRADGDIYAADLRTGQGRVISQGPGTASVGLKIDNRGLLYVAGGPSGTARVVNTRTGNYRSYTLTTLPSFINDVVLTKRAAWFTNSLQPELYRLSRESRTVTTLPLSGDWVQLPGFNANGITQTPDGRALLVVQSPTGLPVPGQPTQWPRHPGRPRRRDADQW